MKTLSVVKLIDVENTLESLDKAFETLGWNDINCVNWPVEFPYSPKVSFQIAHTENNILLHYEVEEEFVRASYCRANENVWEDSCVEFFLSLDGQRTYFNFEFNVLMTGLIGFGTSNKAERSRLSNEVIDSVNGFTRVNKVNGKKIWELYILIPKNIFEIQLSENKVYHANFYKCGDSLPTPHFISWNAINYPTPNFHLPEFFGEIIFLSN